MDDNEDEKISPRKLYDAMGEEGLILFLALGDDKALLEMRSGMWADLCVNLLQNYTITLIDALGLALFSLLNYPDSRFLVEDQQHVEDLIDRLGSTLRVSYEELIDEAFNPIIEVREMNGEDMTEATKEARKMVRESLDQIGEHAINEAKDFYGVWRERVNAQNN